MQIRSNSLLAKKILRIWSQNSQKIYCYENNQSFRAIDLLDKIKILKKKIKKNYRKRSVVFMNEKNSVDWVCAYLTFKLHNFYIIVIPNSITDINFKLLIDFVKPNIIFKKNDIFFNNRKKSLLEKILKKKKIHIKNISYDFLFTTGTTSFPKGVCIPESSYLKTSRNLIKILKQSKNDTELLSMPFSHSFGLTRLRCCLIGGQKFYITDGLKNFPEIYKNMIKYNVNGLSLVPSAIELIKALLKKRINNFSNKIKYFEIGSSSLSLNTRKWLKKNFKITNIKHHFGSTEASRSFFAPRGSEDNLKLSSSYMGTKAGYIKYRLRDPKTKKINKYFGEMEISGKNLAAGYFCGEDKNEKAFSDNWFKTSDIVIKKNRLLYFKGKKNSIINIGGNKILPEEIEKKIELINKVKISLCGGVKDAIFGERIAVIVVLNKDSQKNRQNVYTNINDIFSKDPFFKRPKIIKFLNKIEISYNGKKRREINYFKKLLRN
jgi:long-chain acyl-CoA synthetase